ncbi:type II secretion system protein [Prosthecobacter dejongeii]|uniref:Uncharacterized protein n=1 Tax=Prosthecobacter dejongeii TaxID=48465 RepID=A0A7W7YID2_9BACT|nr:hypothetical protein [Prosthecobacter dejongeii]MBB5036597.1 hypothetical protein [Prosthecobacter dejongeii]
MRHTAVRAPSSGFTMLESLLMICLMTVLALMTWGIYLKETDPARKGPGVWEKVESPFVPAFREVDNPVIIVPDPPLKNPVGQPQ